jgi:hypothetical protein
MTTHTTSLATASIVADEGFQPRRELNESHVRQLMVSDPDTWPPLTVAVSDDGTYFLGLETLACVMEPGGGYPEAFAANQRHGLTLTVDERKDFVHWLAEHEPGLSYRELGRRSGLNHETVKRALTEPEDAEPAQPVVAQHPIRSRSSCGRSSPPMTRDMVDPCLALDVAATPMPSGPKLQPMTPMTSQTWRERCWRLVMQR